MKYLHIVTPDRDWKVELPNDAVLVIGPRRTDKRFNSNNNKPKKVVRRRRTRKPTEEITNVAA